jgi:hypothetical protein
MICEFKLPISECGHRYVKTSCLIIENYGYDS